ncbi:MAG: hypothetical protein RIR70_1040 [Pseudomonadota bacterium]|jgi:hypothetical protein
MTAQTSETWCNIGRELTRSVSLPMQDLAAPRVISERLQSRAQRSADDLQVIRARDTLRRPGRSRIEERDLNVLALWVSDALLIRVLVGPFSAPD